MGSFLQKIYTFIAFSTSVFKFGSIVQKMRILSPTIELWRKINTRLILAHFFAKPDVANLQMRKPPRWRLRPHDLLELIGLHEVGVVVEAVDHLVGCVRHPFFKGVERLTPGQEGR